MTDAVLALIGAPLIVGVMFIVASALSEFLD